MSKEKWFSAKLRFAIMIEPTGADTLNDCVFVFRATDFGPAFDKAISIGKANEARYKNVYGKDVAWQLVEVISLDILGPTIRDGLEVYSERVHLKKKDVIPYGTKFRPRKSKTKAIQTI